MKPAFYTLAALLAVLTTTAAIVVWILKPPPPLRPSPQGGEISGVLILNPGEAAIGPVTLSIAGNRIDAITLTPDAPVGSFALPGLANAHAHTSSLGLPGEDALFALLHLYHGVTRVRLAAGDHAAAEAVRRGDHAGPGYTSCGPFLDGDPPQWPSSLVITDADTARAAVQQVAAQGYDCIKVYNELRPGPALAVHEAARQAGLTVIGHVPWRQDITESHIDDIQHTLGWAGFDAGDGDIAQVRRLLRLAALDANRVAALSAHTTGQDVALTPTLVTLQRKYGLGDYAALRDGKAASMMPHFYRLHWWHRDRGLVSSRLFDDADRDRFRALFPAVLDAVGTLHAAGARLHSGTDSPAEFIVPGAGLVEELHLLQHAGLSPEDALAVSAVATARSVAGPEYGRIAVGAPADLVIYEQDPTLSLDHLDSRLAVISDGRIYPHDALEAQLQVYRDWFNRPAYRWLTETLARAGLGMINVLARDD